MTLFGQFFGQDNKLCQKFLLNKIYLKINPSLNNCKTFNSFTEFDKTNYCFKKIVKTKITIMILLLDTQKLETHKK